MLQPGDERRISLKVRCALLQQGLIEAIARILMRAVHSGNFLCINELIDSQ